MTAIAHEPAHRRLYTLHELSEITGFTVKTLHKMIDEGVLPTHPAFKGRGRTRFTAGVVERLLRGEPLEGGDGSG